MFRLKETLGKECIIIKESYLLNIVLNENRARSTNDWNKQWRVSMEKKKTSLSKDVEDTMACSAFAEAGEPCPIHEEKKTDAPTEGEKIASESIGDTMACSAFAEAGEPCPIHEEKKVEEQKDTED